MGADTPYWELALGMAMVGVGIGSTQQNLVLAVQNQVALRDMGAASSTVAFFRSLGGAAGVAALGALLSSHVSSAITSGLTAAGIPASATSSSGGQIPNLATLPAAIRTIVENAYGDSVALMFLVAAPLALIALVAILFLREVPLRDTVDVVDTAAPVADAPGDDEDDDEGRYRVAVDESRVPHLLVVQWRGDPHVELIGGPVGGGRRDV